MRRTLPFLVVFLLGAFLGRPLMLHSFGLCIKAMFYIEQKWHLSYRSIHWYEGKIVLANVHLKDQESFQISAPKLELYLSQKHLQFHEPSLSIHAIPQAQDSDWTVGMTKGSFRTPHLAPAQFTFEKTSSHQIGRLCLDWGGSSMVVEGIQVDQRQQYTLFFNHFDAALLHGGYDIAGVIHGKAHFSLDAEGGRKGALQLSVAQGRYKNWVDHIQGTIDWEGDLAQRFSLWQLQKGRLKLHLEEASFGPLEELCGELSFTSDVGAKWAFEAKSLDQPIHCDGRFFSSHNVFSWMEGSLRCGSSQIAVNGKEEAERFEWEIQFEKVDPFLCGLIQAFVILPQGTLQQGLLDGSSRVYYTSCLEGWDLHLVCQDCVFEAPQAVVSAQTLEANISTFEQTGELKLSSMSVALATKEPLWGQSNGWDGVFSYEQQKLHGQMAGEWMGLPTTLQIEGALDRAGFAIESPHAKMEGAFVLREDHVLFPSLSVQTDFCSLEGKGKVYFDQTGDFSCQGMLASLIPFRVAQLRFQPDHIFFDAQIPSLYWDLARMVGTSSYEGVCAFDLSRSHILGEPFSLSEMSWGKEGVVSAVGSMDLSYSALRTLLPSLSEKMLPLSSDEIGGGLSIQVNFAQEDGCAVDILGKDLCFKGETLPFKASFESKQAAWVLKEGILGELSCRGEGHLLNRQLILTSVQGKYRNAIHAECQGKVSSLDEFELLFPHFQLTLELLPFLPYPLKGELQGRGTVQWNECLDVDFDLEPSAMAISGIGLENTGSLHVHYDPDKGIAVQGLDLSIQQDQKAPIYCKAQLAEYKDCLRLSNAHLCIPQGVLARLPHAIEIFDRDLDVTLDVSSRLDGSEIVCTMEEGYLPIQGAHRHIKELKLSLAKENVEARFQYIHAGTPIQMELTLRGSQGAISLSDPKLTSSLPPLRMQWDQEEQGLFIREITGSLGPIDAAFHAVDKHCLIGSVRFDCEYLTKLLPFQISKIFTTLKMGRGYELKGRLYLNDLVSQNTFQSQFSSEAPSLEEKKGEFPQAASFKMDLLDRLDVCFEGIVSGKQIEFMGFEFRSLFASTFLSKERVSFENLKMSDAAGLCTVDQMTAYGTATTPWILSIPSAQISEWRPSLLKKVGHPAPKGVGPLVVRSLTVKDLKGFVDDLSSYRGKGEMTFINSYRREYTLFDIPSDLLSRLGGFDFSLLVPVCGTLHYRVSEGAVLLTQLEDAYSEGRRSQFFLVNMNPSSYLDLSGDLNILIEMKQFGLFKFMESFMISIQGDLMKPTFHLQKKQRFWGFK